jgi:hypothetical protein
MPIMAFHGGVGGMAGAGVYPPKTRAVATVTIHAGKNTGGPTIASRSAAWKSARVTSIRTTAFRPTIGKVASNGRSDWDADRDDRDWDRDPIGKAAIATTIEVAPRIAFSRERSGTSVFGRSRAPPAPHAVQRNRSRAK